MDRRTFLSSSLSAAGGFALQGQQQTQSRPNVIWILGDQMRAQALSCAGDPNAVTPNLDALSAQGVRFSSAVSGMPLCCPFRGTMLTSRYPHHCVPGHQKPLPLGQPTIANVFNDAGYHTAYFGKWHLGGFDEANGRAAMFIVPPELRGGFNTWTGYENNNSQYDCWVHGGQGKDAFHYRLPGYETDELTNLLIGHIKDRAQSRDGKPFFAVLSVQPPHDPYVAPPDYMRRYNAARLTLRPNVPDVPSITGPARRNLAGYYAQIENLDWNVGRVREVLAQTGLEFNTHIMFFADHGDMHGSHGQFLKMTAYDEAIRIPMIVAGEKPQAYEGRGTGVLQPPFAAVDISPTTLGLCGIARPSWMEGYDYSHYRVRRANRPAEPDSAFLQSVIPTMHANSVDRPWRGVVTRDGWKYTCFDGVPWMLFNLNDDPFEEVNMAHNVKYRAERRRLTARLRQWIADTGDRFNVPEA